MGMGQGIWTGSGHGGITCVLEAQVSSFFFVFVFFWRGGGEQGNMAIYFKGTFLGGRRWRVRSSGPAGPETFPPTSDSSRAAVGGWQKDRHLVLVNGLEAYPGTVWLGAPTVSKMT